MMNHSPFCTSAHGSGRPRWLAMVAAFVAILFTANVIAQAPAAPGGTASERSAEELEKLVGRVALYPDDLVAVILPAATNPLQIVQADRFLDKRKSDPKAPLDDKWDDAVKTLVNYPEVVKMMSSDLDWTSDLGEAVVEDQGEVLEAIQAYRRKVQSAGNLKSDAKQTVVVEKEVIKIVPADPQVVYVPQYNPSTVVVSGTPAPYGYYPAPYPSYYYPYPPGAAMATGLIWGAAIGAAWSGNHYGANYSGGGNTINIDNSKNVNRSGSSGQRPAATGSSTSQWKSNKQPGQVSGSVGKTSSSARVGDSRGGAGGGSGGARPSTQQAGGGAFGGSTASGHQTQMDSSRGASSRGSTSGAGAGSGSRPSPSASGGGARPSPSAGGGGGGAGGRGGGGGGRR